MTTTIAALVDVLAVVVAGQDHRRRTGTCLPTM
jgi:hypothetical protein